jgi:hypothetical protein
MRSFMILVLLVVVLAVGVSVYDAALTPAASGPDSAAAPPSVAAGHVFLLMPDGKVEVSDAWARRVFQWDGTRWIEHDPSVLASAHIPAR